MMLLADSCPAQVQEMCIPSSIVEPAREKLMQFLNVDAEEVILESFRFVRWNDGSLGCPKEGVCYLHVLTPGYQLVFLVRGERFRVHTDLEGRRFVSPDFQLN